MPHPAIDRALAAALSDAEPDELPQVATALLDRGGQLGRDRVIERFDRLPGPLQERVLGDLEGFASAVRRSAARTRSVAGGNAVEVIRRGRLASMAYLVTGVLRRGDPPRRAVAGRVLLELADWAAKGDAADGAGDAKTTAYVVSAVEEAVVHYGQHRRPEAIAALLRLQPRRMRQVERALQDPQHPAVWPLSQALRRAEDAPSRAALLSLLIVPTLADAALEGLVGCVRDGQLGDVLVSAHLLKLPAVRRALEAHGRWRDLCPPPARLAQVAADRQPAVAAWLAALPMPEAQRLAWLNEAVGHMSAPMRRRLARRLAHDAVGTGVDAGSMELLMRLSGADDGFAARVATRALVRIEKNCGHNQPALSRHLASLVNSPHDPVAALARRRMAATGFARLWERWPGMDEAQRLAAAQALLKVDPGFHDALGRRLDAAQQATVLRALHMVAVLGQGLFFERRLLALAEASDHRLVASAAAALGSAGSDAATRAIGRLLGHHDNRVRANAVEAWQRLDPAQRSAYLGRLQAMAANEANRPRANAIRALIELGEAHAADTAKRSLSQMLDDQRPAHRLSALWVADAVAADAVAARVGELAVSDPDTRVRARAEEVFERIVAALAPPGVWATTTTRDPASLARIEKQAAGRRSRQGAA